MDMSVRHISMSARVRVSKRRFAITPPWWPRIFIAKDVVYGLIGRIAAEYRIAYELILMSCFTVTFVSLVSVFGSSLMNTFTNFMMALALGATVQSFVSHLHPITAIRVH
jgi:hypothetical protein